MILYYLKNTSHEDLYRNILYVYNSRVIFMNPLLHFFIK